VCRLGADLTVDAPLDVHLDLIDDLDVVDVLSLFDVPEVIELIVVALVIMLITKTIVIVMVLNNVEVVDTVRCRTERSAAVRGRGAPVQHGPARLSGRPGRPGQRPMPTPRRIRRHRPVGRLPPI
jgi:hypothetical protein